MTESGEDHELRAEENEAEEGPIAHCALPPDKPRPGIGSAAEDHPGREADR